MSHATKASCVANRVWAVAAGLKVGVSSSPGDFSSSSRSRRYLAIAKVCGADSGGAGVMGTDCCSEAAVSVLDVP